MPPPTADPSEVSIVHPEEPFQLLPGRLTEQAGAYPTACSSERNSISASDRRSHHIAGPPEGKSGLPLHLVPVLVPGVARSDRARLCMVVGSELAELLSSLDGAHDDVDTAGQGDRGSVDPQVITTVVGDIGVIEAVDVAMPSGVGLMLSTPGAALVQAPQVHRLGDTLLDRAAEADVQRPGMFCQHDRRPTAEDHRATFRLASQHQADVLFVRRLVVAPFDVG